MGLDRAKQLVLLTDYKPLETQVAVVGTNGKGTFAFNMQQVLTYWGYNVLSFTSPHINCIKERITLNGQLLDDSLWFEAVNELEGICAAENLKISYFEALFAVAMLISNRLAPDVVIWEAGLGGRLDAINSLPNFALTVLTQVALDHTEFLGRTLPEIMFEKLAIRRRKTPFVIGDLSSELYAGAHKYLKKRAAEPLSINQKYPQRHRQCIERLTKETELFEEEAKLLVLALSVLDLGEIADLPIAAIGRPAGRLAWHSNVLLDVAHNQAAVSRLVDYVLSVAPVSLQVAFNLRTRKDIDPVIETLSPLFGRVKQWLLLDLQDFHDVQYIRRELVLAGVPEENISIATAAKFKNELSRAYTGSEQLSFLAFGSFQIVEIAEEALKLAPR